ncbi:MAG: 30S ribosome-binding factor RbfA [Clostridia bacterium]|nr:30S ribosome-binding factor RbfA [Oscillospiraceae bacterium]MDY5626660.1 30S ribosome-binding factor RbfA [Clostridia bacterium]
MAGNRLERIKEEVKRELSGIIRRLKDPRIADVVSVVAVDITKDLKYAKAHISVMGTDDQKKDTITALNSAAGFIRREISANLDLRNTPEFKFVPDNSVEYGIHIDELIHKINKNERD